MSAIPDEVIYGTTSPLLGSSSEPNCARFESMPPTEETGLLYNSNRRESTASWASARSFRKSSRSAGMLAFAGGLGAVIAGKSISPILVATESNNHLMFLFPPYASSLWLSTITDLAGALVSVRRSRFARSASIRLVGDVSRPRGNRALAGALPSLCSTPERSPKCDGCGRRRTLAQSGHVGGGRQTGRGVQARCSGRQHCARVRFELCSASRGRFSRTRSR
jgi:hypothetical protein